MLISPFQIISRSLADIEYVRSLHGRLGKLVTEAYITCLGYTHGTISPQFLSADWNGGLTGFMQESLCSDPWLLSVRLFASRNAGYDLEWKNGGYMRLNAALQESADQRLT
jgi:hypothetical protein